MFLVGFTKSLRVTAVLTAIVAAVATGSAPILIGAPAQAGIPDASSCTMGFAPITTSVAAQPGATDSSAWVMDEGNFDGSDPKANEIVAFGSAPELGPAPMADTTGAYISATPDGKGFFTIDMQGNMGEYGTARGAVKNISEVSGWRADWQDNGTGELCFENPVSGIASTSTGQGGWVLDSTGQVWPFGDAQYHGQPEHSMCCTSGDAVDIAATSDGGGYTIVTARGWVYDFGTAQYHGGEDFGHLDAELGGTAATGIALTPDDGGYWIVDNKGTVHAHGSAEWLGNNPTNATGDFHTFTTDISATSDGYVVTTAAGNAAFID